MRIQVETKEPESGWLGVITSYPARLALYTLTAMAVYQVVYAALQARGAVELARENGPLELAQIGLLLIAAVGIAVAVKWTPIGRSALVVTGAVTLYAAARESDLWFETYFFDDAYKWLVGLPAAVAVGTAAYLERHKLVDETLRISRNPGATLFTVGGILLCCFCQMLDRPLFWPQSGLEGVAAGQKELVEESAELFAYLLIAFSGFEAMIAAARDRALLKSESLADRTASAVLPLYSAESDRAAA